MPKQKMLVWLVVISLLSAVSALAQNAPDRPLYFDVQREPSIPHGAVGQSWDGRYTDPGAVVYYDGKFHMFRNGFANWPDWVGVAYHVSDDGLNWQEVSVDPVLRTEDAPVEVTAALASSVLVEDDSTWVMYLYGFPKPELSANGAILRATAPAPEGPWTYDPEPVLTHGAAGSWDGARVSAPSVIKTDDGYMMFYEGIFANGPGHSAIGMATSPDGMTWTKYDDPATADAPYAESDPVFTAEDVPWSPDVAHQPRVALTPDGIALLYRTYTGRQGDISFGLAYSDDGVTWRSASDEPVVKWNDRAILNQIWYSELTYANGELFGYFEVNSGMTTNIHASRLVGMPAQ